MTKPVTSVALMLLVDRGLVDLDAPVSTYLADFAGREVLVGVDTVADLPITRPASREISVRDLLRHTSGFGYLFSNQKLLTLAQNGGFGFRDQPILHDPGERWTYGMGTAVVGWIVEEVSGKTLAEFFESELFTVLGMEDTSFELSPDRMHRVVDYMRRTDGVLVADPVPDSVVGEVRGDHGLFSTADDYARFLRLILNDGMVGSRRLLSRQSIEELSRDQLLGMTVTEQPGAMPDLSNPFPRGAGSDGFSLAFQVSVEEEPGRRAPGSLTWAGLANTHFWIDPDTGIGVVLLFQLLPFYDEAVLQVMDRFERALYGEALTVR